MFGAWMSRAAITAALVVSGGLLIHSRVTIFDWLVLGAPCVGMVAAWTWAARETRKTRRASHLGSPLQERVWHASHVQPSPVVARVSTRRSDGTSSD